MGVTRVAALFAMSGCFWATTKSEGEAMQKQIHNLDQRVGAQEQVLSGRVKQLDESIDKATKMLARSGADLGTRVDQFSDELAQFSGRLEMLQRSIDAARTELAQVKQDQQSLSGRMDSIERQLGITPGAPASQSQPVTVDKAVLFDNAYKALQAGKFDDARRQFRLYVQAFPQDDKADDAAFYIGESFFRQKDYEKAIAEYQKVIDGWPKGDMADDAFLQAGLAAIEKGWCVDAGAYLGELIRRFPQSPLAKTAKTKLDYVKKNAKNTKVCKS